MTILVAMSPEAFSSFVEEAVAGYAADNVAAGRWPEASAAGRARAEFDRLLPLGLATPGHRLCEVRDEDVGATVGSVWFATVGGDDERSGYLYNLRIKPEFRGRGYAKAALERIEQLALADGLSGISLHVFGFNTGAQALYRSMGYGITGINMAKRLVPPPGA